MTKSGSSKPLAARMMNLLDFIGNKKARLDLHNFLYLKGGQAAFYHCRSDYSKL
jgi:uncharacterized protein YigE (DUF2233 family)